MLKSPLSVVVKILGSASVAWAISYGPNSGDSKTNPVTSIGLPPFLGDSPLVDGLPWGHTEPLQGPPDTGVRRKYTLTITRGYRSPDGFNKSMLLVNNQYPGPLLEANWGDIFEIEVINNLKGEGITLHWHGQLQKKTPWYDGVPGVSQCPIAPGKSLKYTFQADQYGTSWYHSHYSGQYGDGLQGPMVIYGPLQPGVSYDVDLGPLMLTDFTHESYYEASRQVSSPVSTGGGPPQNLDSNLINGQGFYLNCSDPTVECTPPPKTLLPKFMLQPGKTHRLRLINSGTSTNQKFSIQDHKFTVFANDYVPVQPYDTDVVTLGVGQRTDVLVQGSGSPSDVVWMHADADGLCANTTVVGIHALGVVYYPDANTNSLPSSLTYPVWPFNDCANDPLEQTIPYYVDKPPSSPSTTLLLNITLNVNSTGNTQFLINGQTFFTDYNDPLLLDANKGQLDYPPTRNVYDFGTNDTVRVILIKGTAIADMHPFHLHGHNFWVLAEGHGTWDGKVTNPDNPLRRDTHNMRLPSPTEPSYLVLEWKQDNPGVWPLHCHLLSHLNLGLMISVLERKGDIRNEMQIPDVMNQTCVDWDDFSSKNVVGQIDSGV